MIVQLAIGMFIIVINAVLQAEMFNFYARRMEKLIIFLRYRFHRFANTATIVVGVLFVMLVHSLQIWIWAFTFHGWAPSARWSPHSISRSSHSRPWASATSRWA